MLTRVLGAGRLVDNNFFKEESMMKEARSQAMEEEKMMGENEMANRENLADENGSDVLSLNTNTNLLEDRNMETMEEMKMVSERETEDMEVAKLTVDFANKLGVDVNTLDKLVISYIHGLLTYKKMDIKELYEELKAYDEVMELLINLYHSEAEIIRNFEKTKKYSSGECEIKKLGKKYLGKEEFNVDELKYEIEDNLSIFDDSGALLEEEALELLEKLKDL
jgi:hypothetical protein